MNGLEADRVARMIFLHLRMNQFSACYDILDDLQAKLERAQRIRLAACSSHAGAT